MKKIKLFALFTLISFNFLYSQICCFKHVLSEDYEIDVKHLALLRMELFNAPEKDSINIDQLWQDSIWEGLTAIFYSTSAGRHAVFEEYCINHRIWRGDDYLRISNGMYIRPDPNVSWFQNWADGNIITNNQQIDSLLLKYGFEEVTFPFVSLGSFVIYTNQNINLDALATELKMNDSIVLAEKKINAGGNQRITYEVINNNKYFDFTLGWGDCPSGCFYWYTWSFVVDEDCNVDYLGSFGDPNIPAWLNCNLTDPIELLTFQEPEFNLPENTFCIDQESIALTGGTPLGGNYSGEGVTNNIFSPMEAGIGHHHITYEVIDSFGCEQFIIDDIYVLESGCVTKTTDRNTDDLIQIFPNPSSGNFHIKMTELNEITQVELFNLEGTLLYAEVLATEHIQFNAIPVGIYFLKISSERSSFVKKVIIN